MSSSYSCYNIVIGHGAPATHGSMTSWCGCNVVLIGNSLQPPKRTGGSCGQNNKQLGIGVTTDYWIVGDCNFNVGIGTTNPDAPVGSGNTAILAAGIVTAYQFYGDGSNLTGISGGGSGGCLKLFQTSNLVSDGLGAGCALTSNNEHNILLGCNAGKSLDTGDRNIIMGDKAGEFTTSGKTNFFGGYAAARCNTSGCYNVIFGLSAGKCGASGNKRVFIGQGAGHSSSGDDNTFLGLYAGCQTTGCRNVSIGPYAGNKTTTGSNNIAIGWQANCHNCTGSRNVIMGFDAVSYTHLTLPTKA